MLSNDRGARDAGRPRGLATRHFGRSDGDVSSGTRHGATSSWLSDGGVSSSLEGLDSSDNAA